MGQLPPVKEAEFQRQVIQFARLHSWRVAHFRPARVMRGGREKYETPVAADGRGFPDLCLVRERVIYAELKSAAGLVSADQQKWITALTKAGMEVFVWRPAHWPKIEEVLS